MRHLIDRVLELQEGEDSLEEESEVIKVKTNHGDEELVELLASLAPRIRVFGCGGCGCNTVQRLEDEGLLSGEHISGFAVNTDAQHLLRSQLNQKILIGRNYYYCSVIRFHRNLKPTWTTGVA